MADLLGATNPVPGYDKAVTNRSIPVTNNPPQLQNVPDLNRVTRADGRTEQQNGDYKGSIRYDSNFQTFVQRLKETPGVMESITKVFAGREGTVVSSGMADGISGEMAKIMQMLQMDEKQLLEFLMAQGKSGTRFGGAFFALLRAAYSRAGSDSVRQEILQFLKSYADHSATAHIEGNMLHNLSRMADAMPARWAEQMRQLLAQLQNSIAAGDRKGSIALLQKGVFPFMSSYVEQTHDMGLPRELLSMLTLDLARYENGSEDKLQELFHQLKSYGTLKTQLQMIDDESLMLILRSSSHHADSPAVRFADSLAAAADRALRGEGSLELQQGLKDLMAAMLVNESVYMPLNHYILPLEWMDKLLFSELWVDPDSENDANTLGDANGGRVARYLLKVDVESLGMFDVLLVNQKENVGVQIACPEKVAPFAKRIEEAITQILVRNELKPKFVSVKKMERPLTLTEVFPKIFAERDGINVKA